jgi:hypothetical protein
MLRVVTLRHTSRQDTTFAVTREKIFFHIKSIGNNQSPKFNTVIVTVNFSKNYNLAKVKVKITTLLPHTSIRQNI